MYMYELVDKTYYIVFDVVFYEREKEDKIEIGFDIYPESNNFKQVLIKTYRIDQIILQMVQQFPIEVIFKLHHQFLFHPIRVLLIFNHRISRHHFQVFLIILINIHLIKFNQIIHIISIIHHHHHHHHLPVIQHHNPTMHLLVHRG